MKVTALLTHPDDEVLIPFTLKHLKGTGVDLKIVYVTSGTNNYNGTQAPSLTGYRDIREAECSNALSILGIHDPTFMRLDSDIGDLPLLIREITPVISDSDIVISQPTTGGYQSGYEHRQTWQAVEYISSVEDFPKVVMTMEWSETRDTLYTLDDDSMIPIKDQKINFRHNVQLPEQDAYELYREYISYYVTQFHPSRMDALSTLAASTYRKEDFILSKIQRNLNGDVGGFETLVNLIK